MWRCLLLTAALILSGPLLLDSRGAEPAAAKPSSREKIRVAAVQMRSTRDLSDKRPQNR